ncbi:MAG TPA: hypothetical protein VKR29_03380 [Candidatus Binataceae bacterium]|nr:hypothetical protein [Candidatus Binataceae bacterium]
MRTFIRCWWVVAMLLLLTAGCSSQSGGGGGSLKVGMTTDETTQAMGQPDLKDTVPDPNHNGGAVLRYTWLNAGEAAVFGTDMRVATIVNVGQSPSTVAEVQQEQMKPPFDPIQTPLDYVFYPVRAAFVVIGAGLNCIGGGGCHAPQFPPVQPG